MSQMCILINCATKQKDITLPQQFPEDQTLLWLRAGVLKYIHNAVIQYKAFLLCCKLYLTWVVSARLSHLQQIQLVNRYTLSSLFKATWGKFSLDWPVQDNRQQQKKKNKKGKEYGCIEQIKIPYTYIMLIWIISLLIRKYRHLFDSAILFKRICFSRKWEDGFVIRG